jgi:hypothetical protein
VDVLKVPAVSAAVQVAGLLASPEIAALIAELEATRWTGRPGYPIRVMVGMALAKSLYAIPTWTKTVRLVREHAALQRALGCEDGCPAQTRTLEREIRDLLAEGLRQGANALESGEHDRVLTEAVIEIARSQSTAIIRLARQIDDLSERGV